MKRFCKTCKKHTEHKVHNQKFKGLNKTHPQSRGSTIRVRKKGQKRGVGNWGRFSRKPIAKWKRSGAKSSKKTDLRYTCVVCKHASVQRKGTRAKKIEMV